MRDLYGEASLVMFPSAYKEGEIITQKPVPFDGVGAQNLTFTRASTATRVNSSGLIEDVATGVPRIDYSGGGCGRLLLEPQRTNLIIQSQDFSNSIWTTDANFASVTSDATTSKWGTLNADKIVADSGGTSHYIRHTNIAVTSDIYTLSIYAKAGEWNSIKISGTNFWATPNPSGEFNLENGTVESEINANASIENIGDGWYRCIVVATTTPAAGGNAKYQIDIGNDNNFSLAGDDTSGLYVIDAQIEKGEYATSIIPTAGAAVTRVVEIGTNSLTTSLQSAGLLGASSGTIIWHCDLMGISQSRTIFALGTDIGVIMLADGRTGLRYNSFGTYGTLAYRGNNEFKFGIKYSGTSAKFYINGNLINSVTLSSTISPSYLSIFNPAFGIGIQQEVKSIYMSATALSDAELEYLTGTSYNSYEEMAIALGYTVL